MQISTWSVDKHSWNHAYFWQIQTTKHRVNITKELKLEYTEDKRLAERTCLQRSVSQAQMQQEEQKVSHLKNK